MSQTYLTTEELSNKIKYDSKTIRQQLKDSVLLEGTHYIRPFGRRKVLYIWEAIEEAMYKGAMQHDISIPMANGATANV